MKAEFDLGTGRGIGEVVKDNEHTVIVEIRSAKSGKMTTIKRHKEKHRVKLLEGNS